MWANFFPSWRRVNNLLIRYQLFYPAVLAGLLLLDIISWVGWVYPIVANLAVIILVLLWLMAARHSLPLAVAGLVLELVVGSQGRMLNFTVADISISLRLALFLAAFSFMIYRLWLKRDFIYLFDRSTLWYGLALLAISWGFIVGVGRGNDWANLFLDLNGYLYLLLWPLFVIMLRTTDWPALLTKIIIGGLIYLGVKTLITFYLFIHFDSAYLLPYYQWWRDTGLGEITYINTGYFRIFSQSHIWSMLATVGGMALLARLWLNRAGIRQITPWLIFILFNSAIIIISMSRSFWLGAVVAWLVICCWFIQRKKLIRAVGYVVISLTVILAANGLVMLVNRLARPAAAPFGAEILTSRFAAGEPASSSRLNLLSPLFKNITSAVISGRGFGATVTYHSRDPRLVTATAGGGGIVTTYAFEWGYLDMWLKLGLFGLMAFLSYLLFGFWNNFKHWWHTDKNGWSFVVPALISLLAVNITTPYLNHPLGLGAIMLSLSFTYNYGRNHNASEQ